jgi:uncharacterized membrane protein YdfJ with MMPL/SSD domain
MATLAKIVSGRARAVLVGTAVFVIVAALVGAPAASLLKTGRDSFEASGSQTVAAREALERATGASPIPDLVVLVGPETKGVGEHAPSTDARGQRTPSAEAREHPPSLQTRVRRLLAIIHRERAVANTFNMFSPAGSALAVSRNGHETYIAVYFKPSSGDAANTTVKHIQSRLAGIPGVTLGGAVLADLQIQAQVKTDLGRAELFAFPILFLLAFIIFRGAVAAILPAVVGGIAIAGTFFALRFVASVVGISIFAVNLITGLGLGLAIDYSLFMIFRYREELAAGHAPGEAIARTLASAGRTIAFSALTVCLALTSLLVFPLSFLRSMGIGGIVVTAFAAFAALVPLTALLVLLGPRVNALAPRRLQRSREAVERPTTSGRWYRLAMAVMRRPGRIALACATLLIVLGLPALGVRLGGVDASLLPTSASARQVSDRLDASFSKNALYPVILAIHAPRSDRAAVARYEQRVSNLGAVLATDQAKPVGPHLWRMDLLSRTGPLTRASQRLIAYLHTAKSPFRVEVTGEAARFYDQERSIVTNLPLALLILGVTTFVVLFLMLDSVVLPVKAFCMNLLTLSAAFGLLELIFQDGRLEGPLGYSSTGTLEATNMVLLFVIGFALATDYGVFLLTRVKEAHDRGASNRDAVALGLERTGRIITAAALLFCVAIGAVATSKILFIKELGVGAGLAVLIDASIVRALLVPALMRLLGDLNWWAPRFLRVGTRPRVRPQELAEVPPP